MAIGPFNALDVGNNKNLMPTGPAVVNHRGGEGSGVIFWMMGSSGEHWVRWEFQDAASQAKGLMNNAIIADYPGSGGVFVYFMSLAANENKWIYLSGDGEDYPGQYNGPQGTHGMHWYFMFAVTFVATGNVTAALAAANGEGAEHPQGVFWKNNNIPGSLP